MYNLRCSMSLSPSITLQRPQLLPRGKDRPVPPLTSGEFGDRPGSGRRSLGSPASDSTSEVANTAQDILLRSLVLDRLAELGQQFPIRIHVEIRRGEIFLKGNVASNSQKLIIQHVIQSLPTVQRVHDQMAVGIRQSGNDFVDARAVRFKKNLRLIVTVAVVLLVGLGIRALQQMPLPTTPIQTRVTYEGIVPAGAIVTLHSKNPRAKTPPYGTVQRDGLVQWVGAGAEAPLAIGEYSATVTWCRPMLAGEQMQFGPNVLPAQYARKETSPLVIAVTKSTGGLVQLDLKK